MSRTQAAATSPKWWGGMSVAIPTAMPEVPLRSTAGRRAGSSSGSSRVPSKLGRKPVVPCPSSSRNTPANGVSRASV